MKTEYELKRDWHFLGGPESDATEKLPAGTKLGVIETHDGSHMTPQQLADAVLRGLAGPVDSPEPVSSGRSASAKRNVKDE